LIVYIVMMPTAVPSVILLEQLRSARSVAVLTGAGVSAESGIPTFRGQDGLWRNFVPEELATAEAFERNPKLVWEWYMWRRALVSGAEPNPGHLALVQLEAGFEDFTLVTQNVDGLHERAGSQNIIELHGNIMRSRCHSCGYPAGEAALDEDGQLSACECGGLLRPDVVWFGELLPAEALKRAWDAAKRANIFLSVGTSSAVQPAAGLADLAKQNGAYLVEINPKTTVMSDQFDERLRGPSGEILPMICRELGLNISSPTAVGH
jgi:NAD-dependent deacetylase